MLQFFGRRQKTKKYLVRCQSYDVKTAFGFHELEYMTQKLVSEMRFKIWRKSLFPGSTWKYHAKFNFSDALENMTQIWFLRCEWNMVQNLVFAMSLKIWRQIWFLTCTWKYGAKFSFQDALENRTKTWRQVGWNWTKFGLLLRPKFIPTESACF